jgi:hypothetical protein
MNIDQIRSLVTQKCGQPPQAREDTVLNELVDETTHQDVREYLRHCLPPETYLASQVRVLPWETILREMVEGSAPGSFIRPFGYLIFATSVGGNVCLHSATGRVLGAGHDNFSDDMIMFQNRTTGKWQYLYEYSPEKCRARDGSPVGEFGNVFDEPADGSTDRPT